jgi:Flp pilus assembly protein TadB
VSFITGAIPLMLYLTIFNPIATPATVSIASGLFLGGALLSAILHYLSLYFLIADRASAVEKLLPDFLSLAVSNLRAGMTPYAAFVHAARPEFGAFHEVVMAAMARVGANASIDSAFFEVASHFDSPLLHRTVTLFAKGVRSGGQLVRLLNSSADEVRRIQDLRAELISSTGTYTIFLSFTVVAIMPFLLAVSSNFVSVFISLQTDMSGISTGAAQLSSFSGKILITSDDMYNIAMLTLLVTTLLMSALIGIVERGKAIYGVKKFPLLLLLSLAAYFVAKAIIASFLSAYTV